MIDRLRKQMIRISTLAVLLVFSVTFAVIMLFSLYQLNHRLDSLADLIASGGGAFTSTQSEELNESNSYPDFYTPETPFSTRFFSVWYDSDGEYDRCDLTAISSVTEDDAVSYGQAVIAAGKTRGWQDQFRYTMFETDRGTGVVFVDGSMNRSITRGNLMAVAFVMLIGMLLIFLLILLFSRKAVSPIEISYEKQKQFITDANHELKTPLTLIMTNMDIVEQEMGHSEWIDDIRIEGQHMSELIGQLTQLNRLDEEDAVVSWEKFSLSDACQDTIAEFSPLISQKKLSLRTVIQDDIMLIGDEAEVRRLMAILLDNAAKYCDATGRINVTLEKKHHIVLSVGNTYSEADSLEIDKLFDRFYRTDKARTAGTGFGIGLSLAKSIAEHHNAKIQANASDTGWISFSVTFKA